MRRLGILLALLAAQSAVVAIVWGMSFKSAGETSEPFLSFEPGDVSSMEIRDEEKQVALRRENGDWILEGGLPADGSRIETILEKLSDASGGWPVATSSSTAERFEVTSDKFQRHLKLHAGDDVLAEFYLGTSPGYRKTHARKTDGGPVYSIEFSNYEASAEGSYWLDKQLLRPSGEIEALEHEGAFRLQRSEDGWTSEPGAELDETLVDGHISRFSNLSVFEQHEGELPADPIKRFVIEDGKGVFVMSLYSVGEGEEDEAEEFAVTSSRLEGHAFGVGSYVAEQINKSLDDLSVKPIEFVDRQGSGSDGEFSEPGSEEADEITDSAE